jgi:hypothetical protein
MSNMSSTKLTTTTTFQVPKSHRMYRLGLLKTSLVGVLLLLANRGMLHHCSKTGATTRILSLLLIIEDGDEVAGIKNVEPMSCQRRRGG